MGSLRMRLLLAILGVAAVSLVLAAWLFRRATIVRFEEFQTAERHGRQQEIEARLAQDLKEHFRQRQSWAAANDLLAQFQKETAVRWLLLDAAGKPAGASSPELRSAAVSPLPDGALEIVSGGGALRLRVKGGVPLAGETGAQIGVLYALPSPGRESAEVSVVDRASREVREFPVALNRSLAMVVAVLLALATAVALWLSRRIVRPVEALTAAVVKMQSGDLQQRVPAAGRDEIGELGRAFNQMTEKLARVEQLRRGMVTDVAHELRTPLTNIRAQIEAFQDGLAQPDAAAIASLHEEALHLARLVDDLRDLALADAGQLRMDRVRLAPAAALEQAIAAVQARATERGLIIERNFNGSLPEIHADPLRFGQILRNLLDNAVRHTPRGGRISVEARAQGPRVDFAVRDTGPGIPAAHLASIFERFYRADESRARETGGAGLGLAIVKHLVIAHGGDVRAESSPGAGATFHFSIPSR